MNYQKLKNEILNGPLAAECIGKSDNEIADILNDKRFLVISSRKIFVNNILDEVSEAGVILNKLEAAAASIPDVKWALKSLLGTTGLDIGNPKTQAQLTALAGPVLTVAEADALKNMALRPASRAEFIGIGMLTANDVGTALRGI